MQLSILVSSYQAVENMRLGMNPTAAVEDALNRINKYYPEYYGALVAVNISGAYGRHHVVNSVEHCVYIILYRSS